MSRIQAVFEAGAGVVTSRGDVHYVVTEYGVADLYGKNIRERATALIEIAHPEFRADLLAAAKQRHYVFPDQRVPRSLPGKETHLTVSGEKVLRVRPLRLSDEEQLQDLFYRLSDESTYQRFLGYKRRHPHEEMLELVDVDREHSQAYVVTRDDEGCEELIAMGRYDVDDATGLADVAFVVLDAWQNQGLGTALFERLLRDASEKGIRGFTADVHCKNARMLGIFRRSGLPYESTLEGGVYHVRLGLPQVNGPS